MATLTDPLHSKSGIAAPLQRRHMQAQCRRMELAVGTPATDRDAFDRLVVQCHEPIRRLVFRLLGWRDGVDDVVQEVFLSAWASWGRLRDRGSADVWLKRIAVNKCRSRLRREAVRVRWLGWLSASRPVERPGELEDTLAAREQASRVRQAVGSLGIPYREVTVLHYYEQMSVEQIAEVVGIRRNTVEVRLHRARRQLEELLADLME